MNPNIFYYCGPNVAEMAKRLGLQLWGHSPDGQLRVSKADEQQPTACMAYREVTRQFHARFTLEPMRPGSNYFRAVERGQA